jgi:hypothetical protein
MIKGKLLAFPTVGQAVEWLLGKTGLKVFVRNSKKYLDWVEATKPVLQAQGLTWHEKFSKYGLQFPLNHVSIKVYHYWADDMERDLTNKLDSLTDLLVSAGIIVNDNWQYLRQIHSESENYHGQIHESITRIDVTQSYFE